jgi:hypothetical protein
VVALDRVRSAFELRFARDVVLRAERGGARARHVALPRARFMY